LPIVGGDYNGNFEIPFGVEGKAFDNGFSLQKSYECLAPTEFGQARIANRVMGFDDQAVVAKLLIIRMRTVGAKHFINGLENCGMVEMLCPLSEGFTKSILKSHSAWRAKHSIMDFPYKNRTNALPLRN
jgi:hypothetical protein